MKSLVMVAALAAGMGGGAVAAPARPTFPVEGNVLVVATSKVKLPKSLPGDCVVEARVEEVLQGARFRQGQALTLSVPCSDGRPHFERGPAAASAAGKLDPNILSQSRHGLVHVDDAGKLIWDSASRSYRTFGQASGYRVLDGVAMPLVRVRGD